MGRVGNDGKWQVRESWRGKRAAGKEPESRQARNKGEVVEKELKSD